MNANNPFHTKRVVFLWGIEYLLPPSANFASLQSRLGIQLDLESIMLSTLLDQSEGDVYELAEHLAKMTGLAYSR